jgi:hypothetical protein
VREKIMFIRMRGSNPHLMASYWRNGRSAQVNYGLARESDVKAIVEARLAQLRARQLQRELRETVDGIDHELALAWDRLFGAIRKSLGGEGFRYVRNEWRRKRRFKAS